MEKLPKIRKNRVGLKFGEVTLTKLLPSKWVTDRQHVMYEGTCSCGSVKPYQVNHLRALTNCGCKDKLDSIVSAARKIYLSYRNGAKNRNLEFSISFETFIKTTQENCIYCQEPPKTIRKGSFGTFIYNGIDRKDSKLGYIENNIQPCCWMCNFAKGNQIEQEFLDWVVRLHKHQKFQIMEDLYQHCNPASS